MKKVFLISLGLIFQLMCLPLVQAQVRSLETPSNALADATPKAAATMPDLFVADESANDAAQEEYVVKTVRNNYIILHLNAKGNVSEYFLVQVVPSAVSFSPIKSVTYRESSDITVSFTNGKYYQFYINDSNLNAGANYSKASVAGIANFQILSPEGYPVDKLAGSYDNIVGSDPGTDCDKRCNTGGCGTSSCEKSFNVMGLDLNCKVTCNAGYFACCGDTIGAGCHCVKDTCCKN